MQALADRDYFTDLSILKDPFDYVEAVRARCPVYHEPSGDLLIVTGFEEFLEVVRNTRDFSAVNGPQGANAPLPFTPGGSDITEQIEAHRSLFMGGDILLGYDDKQHAFARSLISGLFTPSRLRTNEAFIVGAAHRLVSQAVARGGCELIEEITRPLATLVIADLLGIPEEDRQTFTDVIAAAPPSGSVEPDDLEAQYRPMVVMGEYFNRYIAERRAHPRDDVLSELANATYPDGTVVEANEIVKLGIVLFGAGQDTSTKLAGNAMRFLVDQPGLQARMRKEPALIPDMLEEVLRLEGSVKVMTRLARRDTRVGDKDVPAGTRLLIVIAGANRDPRRWEDPSEFILGRPKIKEHLAFGRGPHVCAGAPLARLEVRVLFQTLLELTSSIELDEAKHGPPGARQLDFEPSFILRGVSELHIKMS